MELKNELACIGRRLCVISCVSLA